MSENTKGLLGMDAGDLEFLALPAEQGGPGYGTWSDFEEMGFPGVVRFRTGTGSLEDMEVGPGRITLFGGPPKRGKTSLVTQLAYDAARLDPGLSVAISNVEMSPTVLHMRQVSRLSGVPFRQLERGNLAREAADRVEQIETHYANDSTIYHLAPPFNTPCLAAWAGQRRDRRRLIVVDYVQRFAAMDPSGIEAWRQARARFEKGPPEFSIDKSRQERMKERAAFRKAKDVVFAGPPCVQDLARVMDDLRSLAMDGAAIIAVSAMSRDSYGSGGLASFRGTSELEYGCDDGFVLMPEEGRPDVVRLHHVASRNSEKRDRLLRFEGPLHRFTPLD